MLAAVPPAARLAVAVVVVAVRCLLGAVSSAKRECVLKYLTTVLSKMEATIAKMGCGRTQQAHARVRGMSRMRERAPGRTKLFRD